MQDLLALPRSLIRKRREPDEQDVIDGHRLARRSVLAVGGISTQPAAIERQHPDHFFLYQPGLQAAGDVGAALGHLAPRRCKLVSFEEDADWPIEGARQVARAMEEAYEAAGKAEALTVEFLKGSGPTEALRGEMVSWLEEE